MIEQPLFYATTLHIEHIVTALNCLLPFGAKEDVLITIDKNGLSFTRENNHVIKIQLLLSKELFQSFHYEPEFEDVGTMVSLKIDHILDSASVSNERGDSIECTLSYNGAGCPFMIIFEDSMITETVEYSTYLIKDIDNTGFVLDRDQLQFECIIKGDILYNAFHDLKEIGCKDCYFYACIRGSSKTPLFALISRSQQGLSKIVLPNEKSILEKFELYANDSTTPLYDKPMICVFDYQTLDKIRISSRIASKVLIRKDVHGLMTVNMLNETSNVMRSIDRDREKPANRSAFGIGLNLPSEYPGIIIEVSVIEKALPELLDIDEVKSLMIESLNTTESYHQPATNQDGAFIKTIDILGGANNEDDNQDAPPIDIPLFF